jgi:hypothetical protein
LLLAVSCYSCASFSALLCNNFIRIFVILVTGYINILLRRNLRIVKLFQGVKIKVGEITPR